MIKNRSSSSQNTERFFPERIQDFLENQSASEATTKVINHTKILDEKVHPFIGDCLPFSDASDPSSFCFYQELSAKIQTAGIEA